MHSRTPVWIVVVSLATSAAAEPLGPAEWLLDLGRDYPLSPQAGLSDADARITLLFMEAAAKVDPALAEPHLWQYDMLTALDRSAEALAAIGRYVDRRPDDVPARLNWLALSIDSIQTADDRTAFCRSQLERQDLPGPVASDLHRRLAESHFERGERDQAKAEIQASLAAYDFNFAARDLMAELNEPLTDPRSQAVSDLKELLFRVRASPGQLALVMAAGDRLMLCGLAGEADRLYAHAAAVAHEIGSQADAALASSAQARALAALGRVDEAQARIADAGAAWRGILASSPGRIDPLLLAEMAWFFADADPQPAQAEKLARTVIEELPDSIVARRALGAAFRHQGKAKQAEETLAAIAERDPWAAIEYAKILYASGRQQEAADQLRSAATRPAGADQRQVMADWMTTWKLTPPASQPASAEARAIIDAFDWAVLDYPLHPEKSLSISWHMIDGKSLAPAEPWRLAVRLQNVGAFPVTFGPDMMVIPDLLVMVETTGDRPRSSGPTIHLSLARRLHLKPGESIETTQAIDVGTVRAGMIGTPQVEHEVVVRGILSPVAQLNEQRQEVWTPALGGLAAEPLWFRRTSLLPTPDRIRELTARSASGSAAQRIQATETLAMLLAEHQHLTAGRLKYAVRNVDPAEIQATLLARSGDTDWQVRARLAECLRWFTLDGPAAGTTARMLSDPHWLVRGLAFRVLADHYHNAFDKVRPVLTKAAEADPDEWVRRMAQALLDRQTPTSAPAPAGTR